MAYGLKYWYETLHEDGKVIRLEIYKKGYTAGSMEIGDVVQGLSLNIGGSEDNIDAPVVSTSSTIRMWRPRSRSALRTSKIASTLSQRSVESALDVWLSL